MAIVCVIANFVFKLTKNAVLVCLENFPKKVVYPANFPNLKGPRAPSQNCKKNPWVLFLIFINDLSDNIRSSVRLFADDCALYNRSIQDFFYLARIDCSHSNNSYFPSEKWSAML